MPEIVNRTRGKTPGKLMPLTYLDESAQRILSNVGLQMACRWSSGIRKRKLGAMIAISPSVAGQAGATLAYAQGSSRPRCSKSKGESTSSCCPEFCPSYVVIRGCWIPQPSSGAACLPCRHAGAVSSAVSLLPPGSASYTHFPILGQNDRVWRQACFQAVLVRSMALSVTTSLRMQAVSASLAGFPARRSRL